MPTPEDITALPLAQLDELGILAAADRPKIEVVDASIDFNAEHGHNTEDETTV